MEIQKKKGESARQIAYLSIQKSGKLFTFRSDVEMDAEERRVWARALQLTIDMQVDQIRVEEIN